MACGLFRAARPTTSTLTPKNTVTMATPTSAPISPLTPTRAALTVTMIAAATAVSAPARRTIVAYFASITRLLRVRQQHCWPGGTTPPRGHNAEQCPASGAGAGCRAAAAVRVSGQVYERYHGPLNRRRGAARETYHKVLDSVFT